jgi:L-threonate 2-dehydrogenase
VSKPVVAIVSPGAMGAAIGARLHRYGVKVVTPAGRSDASRKRARAAGIDIVEEAALGEADFLFSIVSPSDAVAVAERMAPHVGRGSRQPLFIDWNAVSPATATRMAGIVESAGGRFADGGIIGLPPGPEGPGPLLAASGAQAVELTRLEGCGVRFKVLEGPVGKASALKLGYAGITKGTIALGAAMLLAAYRAGCGDELVAELAASQAQVFAGFQRSIPDMFGKAARWVPELNEIAAFAGADRPEGGLYAQMAAFYGTMAADVAGEGALAALLSDMLKPR